MKFIELTDEASTSKVWVNPHLISAFSETGRGGTRIIFENPAEATLFVKEPPAFVLDKAGECD